MKLVAIAFVFLHLLATTGPMGLLWAQEEEEAEEGDELEEGVEGEIEEGAEGEGESKGEGAEE